MIATADILKEAPRILRSEFPKHLPADFVVDDVEAESQLGPYCEDYIHVNVILDDDHPALDPRQLPKFKQALRPMFEGAGIVSSPTISYSNRSELAR